MSTNEDARITTTEPIHDLYLRMLIFMLESDGSTDSSMSITLSTNSGVITGQLINRKAWKDRWAHQLETATGNGAELLSTFFEKLDETIDQLNEELDEENDELPRFVHLRDVTMFVPGASTLNAPLWRGRLESVVGWSIGTF